MAKKPRFSSGTPVVKSVDAARSRMRVVAIGASAGGLEALMELLRPMAADTGLAFVVILHLDPGHKSALVEILQRVCSLTVREAEEGMTVEPNGIYVIPPDRDMVIDQGVLHLSPRAETSVPRRIDTFLQSLAKDVGNRAIGVILSGAGGDGTQDLKDIRETGGLTFAQDDTARFSSMPHTAIAAGVVDAVLSPAQIAAELQRIGQQPPAAPLADEPPEADVPDKDVFLRILHFLHDTTGVDFLNYMSGCRAVPAAIPAAAPRNRARHRRHQLPLAWSSTGAIQDQRPPCVDARSST